MKKEEFMNETMDLKKMFLCLKKDIIRVLIATLIGAVLCGTIYLSVRHFTRGVFYQSYSQFYINFAGEIEAEANHHYNAFTWNDLLHADPVIEQLISALKTIPGADEILSDKPLSEQELSELLRDDIFRGDLFSDRRLLTVTFTTHKPEKTVLIQTAMEIGLPIYAVGQREIDTMEVIRTTEPKLLVWDSHLHRAVIGGAVLFLLLALFIWWFKFILDDSLYTLADAEKRYPFPAIGILLKGENTDTEEFYFSETKENLAYILKDEPKPIYLSVQDYPYPDGTTLRNTGGVILLIPFARRNGKKIERCISYLQNQDTKILGLIITEANIDFLKLYYKT